MAACYQLVVRSFSNRRNRRLGASSSCRFDGNHSIVVDGWHHSIGINQIYFRMKRTLLWVLLGLTAVIAVVWPRFPLASAEERLRSLPLAGPDFQSVNIEPSATDLAFLGQATAVRRLITMRGGGQLVLTVIDGTRNRHAVHDPRYCFSGSGWVELSKQEIKLRSGTATQVAFGNAGKRVDAIWFFDDGRRQFDSPLEYWWRTGLRRASLGRSGDEPLLVSLQGVSGAAVDWSRVRQVLLPALGFE